MAGYRYSISLRVWHPSRSLDDLTVRFGVVPRRICLAGTPRTTPKGKPLAGVNDRSYWTARLAEGTDSDLPAALGGILDRLAADKDFLIDLTDKGAKCEFFIGWFFDEGNSGDVFSHALLQRLAEFRINLSFDVYGQVADTASEPV